MRSPNRHDESSTPPEPNRIEPETEPFKKECEPQPNRTEPFKKEFEPEPNRTEPNRLKKMFEPEPNRLSH